MVLFHMSRARSVCRPASALSTFKGLCYCPAKYQKQETGTGLEMYALSLQEKRPKASDWILENFSGAIAQHSCRNKNITDGTGDRSDLAPSQQPETVRWTFGACGGMTIANTSFCNRSSKKSQKLCYFSVVLPSSTKKPDARIWMSACLTIPSSLSPSLSLRPSVSLPFHLHLPAYLSKHPSIQASTHSCRGGCLFVLRQLAQRRLSGCWSRSRLASVRNAVECFCRCGCRNKLNSGSRRLVYKIISRVSFFMPESPRALDSNGLQTTSSRLHENASSPNGAASEQACYETDSI